MQRRIAIVLAAALFASSCGSGSKSPASSGSLSGNWLITMTKTDHPTIVHTQSGSLLQNGDAISGNVLFTDIPCSGVASVSGTVSGTAVTLNVDPVGTSITLVGTVSSGAPPMSGSYTILSTGCVGPESSPEVGSWSASLIPPLSGKITGSFTSSAGVSYAVTGQVSQAANTGSSSTPLSGNISVAGYCFAAANIVGAISGTSVTMNMVSAEGVDIGQANGSVSGSMVSGPYHVVPQGVGGTEPCVDGANGTISLTVR